MSRNIRPYWARVAVIPARMDEVEFPSGLIAPFTMAPGIERGVVEETHESHSDRFGFAPGAVVYYYEGNGIQIGDVKIVELNDVIAYEDPDS